MGELKRRGFDARPAGSRSDKHRLLVWADGSTPKPIQVRTVHSAPWSVRRAGFAKRADQVTVYVLLGAETTGHARFFVVRNSDLASEFRLPPTWSELRLSPTWKAVGFIDVKSVEKYEDNWEILR
jgi:hypothetical protein